MVYVGFKNAIVLVSASGSSTRFLGSVNLVASLVTHKYVHVRIKTLAQAYCSFCTLITGDVSAVPQEVKVRECMIKATWQDRPMHS